MILITENWPGNIHKAAIDINEMDLGHYVLSIGPMVGSYTILVFCVPNAKAIEVQRTLGDRSMTDEARANLALWAKRKERDL